MALHLHELSENSDVPETITLDMTDEEIGKLRIGQKIEIVIKGSVGMLQVPPQGSSADDPALMGIRMTSKTINKSNEFAELAEENDDEDD